MCQASSKQTQKTSSMKQAKQSKHRKPSKQCNQGKQSRHRNSFPINCPARQGRRRRRQFKQSNHTKALKASRASKQNKQSTHNTQSKGSKQHCSHIDLFATAAAWPCTVRLVAVPRQIAATLKSFMRVRKITITPSDRAGQDRARQRNFSLGS